MENFTVDTSGHCFLCSNKIAKIETNTVAQRAHSSPPPSSAVHSLQYLSRYLRLDITKVFDEERHVPPELLAKVERARLKVELCEGCARLNETFSKLYRKLERTEMEMATYVNLMHGKLLEANKAMKSVNFSGQHINNLEATTIGKLRIVDVLRKETMEKCLRKPREITYWPRIKLEKWSMKQVDARKRKIKASFLRQKEKTAIKGKRTQRFEAAHGQGQEPATTEIGAVKEEFDSLDMEDADISNDYHDDNDDYHGQSDTNSSVQSPLLDDTQEPFVANTEIERNAQEAAVEERSTDPMTVTNYVVEADGYKCKLCSKKFRNSWGWKAHYKSFHQNIKYKCNLCGAEFGHHHVYKRHHQNIHMGIKFKCLVCNKTFSMKTNLATHQRKRCCKNGKA